MSADLAFLLLNNVLHYMYVMVYLKKKERCHMTILEISKGVSKSDKRNRYGQFLDDFYRADHITKQAMINDEPDSSDDPNNIFVCELACAVTRLAGLYGLECPAWTQKKQYYLTEPHFAFDTKNAEYQDFLMQTTPKEYAERNLYMGNNILKRC